MHRSSSKLVLALLKICGIAPYRSVNNDYIFSAFRYICGLIFWIIIVSLGLHALFSDYQSTFRSKSVRMKTRTAIVVTFLEILLSMLVVTSGIVGSAISFSKIKQIGDILRDVDDRLGIKCDFFRFDLMVGYLLAHHAVLILIDSWYWFRLAPHSWSYVVCYAYTFIEIAIETQFALVVSNIGARFDRINERLRKYFDVEDTYLNWAYVVGETEYAFEAEMKVKKYRQSAAYAKARRQRFVAKSTGDGFDFGTFELKHWSLCECVRLANRCFGWQLLVSILCNCVHIIVTPYFLLLNLFYPAAYGSADLSFLALQVVWVITHIMHLLFIVLPAANATDQAKQSIKIICENLLTDIPREEVYETRLETFVLHLKKLEISFSACGLFTLKKPIVTSLIGCVITYLVILIQFQNSDKVYH